MEADLKIDFYYIKLYVTGLLFLFIVRKDFVGFHAWMDNNGKYSIEFVTRKKNILTELDNKEKWQSVLKLLDEKLKP